MSSPVVVNNNVNASSIGQQKPAGAFCSSINTTAKSTATTVTSASSAKKSSRKSETENITNGTNFLPIAPHQTFYSSSNHHHHQAGIALASVQQQQQSLQSSGVTVFSSPNMMTTQQQGPQTAQLVVNAQGQHMQTFNNGQGIIQTANGMGMIQGLPQMQMIQTAPGQPTYTMPLQQFQYAGPNMSHMQPIILAPSNIGMFQQSPSQLAIQIPNGNNTNTMITNQITTNANNTPVKPAQQQGQTIIKSVSMSPQQPQATKSSAATTPAAMRGQAQPNQQQQTIIGTPTFQTTGTQNQTFVIGTFQSQPNGQANGATIISTPNNNRKNNTSGANIIHQKIQPATSLATTPMIAPAQFKTNNSPFQTAQNGTSPGTAQTIMVHGQNLQSGPGGLQLATNPTIISSFNPGGITWTTNAINQPQTQLVAPNGQPIFFRSQSADGQPQMFIQTGNNQFQALPMQMTQGTPQQANTANTMQMTTGHQQMVASSVNQTMPLIQATTNHQTVGHASPMLQQSQQTAGTAMTGGMNNTTNNINNMTQGTVITSQSISTPTSTQMANASRQRPIRPASNNSISSAGKQKVSLDARSNVTNASPVSVGMQAKLAPKNSPMTTNTGTPNSTTPVRPGLLSTQQGKLPLAMTKASDGTNPNVKNASVGAPGAANTFNSANNTTANKVGQKVGTFTPSSSAAPGTVMTSSSTLNVSSSGTMMTSSSSSSTLVNSALNPSNRSTSPALSLNKVNQRKVEKKDSSTGTLTPTYVTKPIKSGLNGVRTSTGFTNKSATPNTSTNSQMASPNTQMINGVLCQVPANPQVKTAATNQKTPNGTSSKSVGIGVQKGLSTPKPKPKQPEKVVLTHVIDGYVIQESPSPFPINGHTGEAENAQKNKEKDSSAVDVKLVVKSESVKETVVNKDGSTSTSNGIKVEQQQTAATSTSTTTSTNFANSKQGRVVGCQTCGKKEMFKNGKDKMKKFCSAACNEAFAQKKALQNGTAPMALPTVMNKVMGQPMMANSIIPPMPNMPMATMPLLQPTAQPIITSISIPMNNVPMNNTGNTVGQMNSGGGGLKRNNLKETNGPVPEKKARVNSPLTVKNDAQMANNKAAATAQQNGLTNVAAGTDSVKEDKPEMHLLEGIWLPGGGKDPPTKWTVQDVYDFINNLEGCSGCADEFRTHEIDGQALMFINEEHIITILKMKLGPALKICRKIKDLKSAYNM